MPPTTSAISASSRHYAEAAFDVARETGDYETWLRALDEAAELLRTPAVRQALTSPTTRAEEKWAVLQRLLPQLPAPVRNLLHILAERDRVGQIPEIAQAFRERVHQERGIITADVTTAIPLDAELERSLAQRLGAYLGHDPARLLIRSFVDPTIIGGVVARVGDRLIDDSVRGRLERLRRTLVASGR